MTPFSSVTDLVNIIQLSVAPVFLLAGIAGFLNVMSGRLSRIIDRARKVEGTNGEDEVPELDALLNRVTVINGSIALCTAAGLMVCTLIMTLFIGGFWELNLGRLVIGLFILALMLLILSLGLLLAEIRMATLTRNIGSNVFKYQLRRRKHRNPFNS